MNTLERRLLTLAAAGFLIAPLCAQTVERRATLRGDGGGNNGKCTIEVYVDGSADVEILGDRGFLRTLSGQPAQWRRFECSGPVPANPSEVRFNGVDGRGRQEMIQEPRNGRGATVVRIRDSDGGAEGYTFDLLWRGDGSGPGPTGPPVAARGGWGSRNDAVGACQNAVREQANRQFRLRDISFRNLDADDNPGRRDTITGTFDGRNNNRDTYHFSCAVDMANGRVRGVEIAQGRGWATADRDARYDALSACESAVEQRIQRDGYRNVQFGRLDADRRRNDQFAGTARAQRGNGRVYDFDIGCTVNLGNGSIKSTQVKRR